MAESDAGRIGAVERAAHLARSAQQINLHALEPAPELPAHQVVTPVQRMSGGMESLDKPGIYATRSDVTEMGVSHTIWQLHVERGLRGAVWTRTPAGWVMQHKRRGFWQVIDVRVES